MAVISLDFSAQATWPSVRPLSLAHAVTRCKAPKPDFLRNDRRAVLPSMAMTFPPVASCNAWVHWNRQVENCWRSNSPKTRRNVSCDGMPLGSGRKVFSQCFRFWPKTSISGQSSAPHRTASKVMAKMSSRAWSQRPWTRGSGRSAKQVVRPST